MSLPSHIYQALTTGLGRKDVPDLRVGETVRVHQRVTEGKKERVQVYEGIVIATKHGRGLDGSFTVRRIATGGVAVEKVFPVHLPSIVRIDRVKRAKVRRAKLYFLRGRQGKSSRFATEWETNKSWHEQVAEELGEPEAGAAEEVTVEAPAEEAVAEELPVEEVSAEEVPTAEPETTESAAE